jgi:gluconokinase
MTMPLPAGALRPAPGAIVVMGVAGCGKTTIGQMLAGRLGAPHAEADAFHPAGNVEKMASGIPLTDQDREPWLAAIADRIRYDNNLVVSCSALKRRYRDILRQADPRTWFLHLVIDLETATERVSGRAAHFMPASLVGSQFQALQPLHDETGLAVDATCPAEEIITAALTALAGPKASDLDPVREHALHGYFPGLGQTRWRTALLRRDRPPVRARELAVAISHARIDGTEPAPATFS